MPTVSFAYPSEDGHLAVSLTQFRRYCVRHQLDPQKALQIAFHRYFDGMRDDAGHLFQVTERQARSPVQRFSMDGLRQLLDNHGLLEDVVPVARTASIDVVFPDQEGEGALTLPRFMEMCKTINQTPEDLVQFAVWELITKD